MPAMQKGYTVVLSPDPGGLWTALCPAMPGAIAEADSRERSLAVMADLMASWLAAAVDDGYGPLPETPEMVAAKVAEVLADRAEEGWDLVVETAVVQPGLVAAA